MRIPIEGEKTFPENIFFHFFFIYLIRSLELYPIFSALLNASKIEEKPPGNPGKSHVQTEMNGTFFFALISG